MNDEAKEAAFALIERVEVKPAEQARHLFQLGVLMNTYNLSYSDIAIKTNYPRKHLAAARRVASKLGNDISLYDEMVYASGVTGWREFIAYLEGEDDNFKEGTVKKYSQGLVRYLASIETVPYDSEIREHLFDVAINIKRLLPNIDTLSDTQFLIHSPCSCCGVEPIPMTGHRLKRDNENTNILYPVCTHCYEAGSAIDYKKLAYTLNAYAIYMEGFLNAIADEDYNE